MEMNLTQETKVNYFQFRSHNSEFYSNVLRKVYKLSTES